MNSISIKTKKYIFKIILQRYFVNLLRLVWTHLDILLIIVDNTKINRIISMKISLEILDVVDNNRYTH